MNGENRSAPRCQFTLNPEEWEDKHDEEFLIDKEDFNTEHGWRCPHGAEEKAKFCIFHLELDRKDEETVANALRGLVQNSKSVPFPLDTKQNRVIGGKFGDVNLSKTIITDSNAPIDLRYSLIDGDLNTERATVCHPIRASGIRVTGDVSFRRCSIQSDVLLRNATFEKEADFYTASIERIADMRDLTVKEEADFNALTVGGDARFQESNFENLTTFNKSCFENEVNFTNVDFKRIGFFDAEFMGEATLVDVTFETKPLFAEAAFGGLNIHNPRIRSSEPDIELRNATIESGELGQPRYIHPFSSSFAVYDVAGATLGEVELITGPDENGLEYLKVENTTFDGFDFSNYKNELTSSEWKIHTIRDRLRKTSATEDNSASWRAILMTIYPTVLSRQRSSEELLEECSSLEATYLKAKNGANTVGDTKAAAEFFRHEMTYRRHQYLTRLLNRAEKSRIRALASGQWMANGLLGLTSGYGESPSRVIATAMAIVSVFSVLFAVIRPNPPYGSALGYPVLSLESFVTLFLNTSETFNEPLVRLIAEVEGFLGAFLVALFVFTLTRSIHR